MAYCKDCKKRNKCKALCKAIEAYLKTIERTSKEIPLSYLGCDKETIPHSQNIFNYSDRKKIFVIYELFFYDHKTVQEIIDITYYSPSYVYQVINKYLHKSHRTHPKNSL